MEKIKNHLLSVAGIHYLVRKEPPDRDIMKHFEKYFDKIKKAKDKPVVRDLRIEQIMDHPADEVWEALTKPDKMQQWFFPEIQFFTATPGYETKFDVISGGRIFRHHWVVMEAIPGQKLVLDWRYTGYRGASLVTFSLTTEGTGTKLVLHHKNVEDYPEAIPEFRMESCRAGWEYFIQKRLPEFLNQY